jgi:hypothetical protein
VSGYTYCYALDVPGVGEAVITPCGPHVLRATSDLVEVAGVAPFYVHRLEPVTGPAYYQLTGNPRQFASLAEAIAAHCGGSL